MNAGMLRDRVTIQRVVRTANDHNELEETTSNAGKRWARVEGQSGREVERANQTTPMATHKVTLRADSLTRTITADDRLLWEGPAGELSLGIVYVDLSLVHEGQVTCLCEAAA